jgi:hypothetical protein
MGHDIQTDDPALRKSCQFIGYLPEMSPKGYQLTGA